MSSHGSKTPGLGSLASGLDDSERDAQLRELVVSKTLRSLDTFKEVDTSANHANHVTPGSTVGAATLVNPTPKTPCPAASRRAAILAHRKANSVRIIVNGHIDGSSAESEDVANATSSSASSNEDPFVVAANGSTDHDEASAYHPRADRDLSEINEDNAQSIFPPNACVFVANLLSTQSDEDLRSAVQEAFGRFGECWTKVRRDEKGMPFAFVQYRDQLASETAIQNGRGMIILGRACRTERAKVPRALYLSRTTGEKIEENEARSVLGPYGDIEKVWHPTPTEHEMFQLPNGIWAMFAYFGDARDAKTAFRSSTTYRLEQPTLPEDLKARIDSRQNGAHRTFTIMSPTTGLKKLRNPDSCSIFLGNLAFTASPSEISQAFSAFGHIRSIEIHSRANSVHGFVEFEEEASVGQAFDSPVIIAGRQLRIEHRISNPVRSVSSGSNPQNSILSGRTASRTYDERVSSMGAPHHAYFQHSIHPINGMHQACFSPPFVTPVGSFTHVAPGVPLHPAYLGHEAYYGTQ